MHHFHSFIHYVLFTIMRLVSVLLTTVGQCPVYKVRLVYIMYIFIYFIIIIIIYIYIEREIYRYIYIDIYR